MAGMRSPDRRLLAVAVLALSACAGSTPAARRTFAPADRDRVFGAAVAELGRRGFALAVQDRDRGVIQTETTARPGRVPCGYVTCPYRDTVQVLVTADAAAEVTVRRELQTVAVYGGGLIGATTKWVTPSKMQRETWQGIAAEQDEILKAIVAP
jgi:hypothetical protein